MRTKRTNRLKKIGNQMSAAKRATNRLADFLNCKYETALPEKVLQQRVLRDLGPLIPPKEKDMTTDKIEFFLAHLQAKINRMNLRPRWVITPAEIALKGLRPGEGITEIFGTRWVVSKRPFSSTSEENVYLDVITSLESGEFSRLRRCGECGLFFVAVHGATVYCGPECQRAHDRRAAPDRVKIWRADKAKQRAEEAQRAAEQRGYKKFCRFWELFNKRRNTTEEGHEMYPILEGLGRGDAARGRAVAGQWERLGHSSDEIWKRLTPNQKKVFHIAPLMAT